MSEHIAVHVNLDGRHVFIGYSNEPAPAAILIQAKRITELEAEVRHLSATLNELAGTS